MWTGTLIIGDNRENHEGKAPVVRTHGPLICQAPGPRPSLGLPPRKPGEVFVQFTALDDALNHILGTVPEDSVAA